MQDRYQHAEEEYFKLRGQFDTGRITQEQFDEKLRALMIQDEQGRYWMLGADSGKWYFYDGVKWVQGTPAMSGAAAVASAPLPEHEPHVAPPANVKPAAVSPPPVASSGRHLPVVPLLTLLALLVLGIAAVLLFQNRDKLFIAQQQPTTITPILPPTITRAPSPTAGALVPTSSVPTLAPVATSAVPTKAPTSAPTQALATIPAVTVVVVTPIPPTTETLPTLLPTATIPAPTIGIPTATKIPATITSVPPTNTALPVCPSGVCVTKIEYSPTAPKRNQDVTFTATFLNTTGGAKNYNWLILLYDPEKTGNNKGFGESPATTVSIPTGESKFSVTYVPVNGPGGCKNLYARAGWKVSAFDKPIFPNTTGDPATVSLDVCP